MIRQEHILERNQFYSSKLFPNKMHNDTLGHSSMTDLVFGMRQRDSGISSYPMRNRQRVISYAITIALREYNPE